MTIQVVKVTVSVPSELVKMADKVAKERKTSRSKVVASCLEELAKKRLEAELEAGYRAKPLSAAGIIPRTAKA
jgi:metal-responsive CopG/Arc/MetJ family transcriptional regulator